MRTYLRGSCSPWWLATEAEVHEGQSSMIVEKLAMSAHALHERAYTWWKCRESGVKVRAKLTADERRFYVDFRSALESDPIVVYDIGAASGVFARCMAKLKNVSRVHAFEPLPSAFQELRNYTHAYPQIICHNVGLADWAGERDMWASGYCRNSSSLLKMLPVHKAERPRAGKYPEDKRERVSVVTLDEFVDRHGLPTPDVVKIDVQGYEDCVLRGGATTISKARFCIVELSLLQLYEGSPLFDQAYKLLLNLKFSLIGIAGIMVGRSGRQLQFDGIFENQKNK